MALPGTSASPRDDRAAAREPAPGPSIAPDWPRQATDQIIKRVDWVRDTTTGKALSAARYLVYGTVIALLITPLLIFILIGAMRLAEHALLKLGEKMQWAWLDDPMWIVYLGFGAAFCLTGWWAWRKAKQTPDPVRP